MRSTQILILTLFICFFSAIGASSEPVGAIRVADQIRSTFTDRMDELTPETQYHFALRMFRITGDSSFIPLINSAVIRIREELTKDLDSLRDSSYAANRTKALLDELGDGNRKSAVRRDLFESRGSLLLDLAILSNCYKLFDHNRDTLGSEPLQSKCTAYLKSVDFRPLVDDPLIVRDFSAQAANAAHYLFALRICDLRADFEKAFKAQFPDIADKRLSRLEFTDKIYGLTHVVIAASDYYQQYVDSTRFSWILRYFQSRKSRILEETKIDVVCEVGICFLLAGQTSHEIVRECRQKVERAFQPQFGMIPSGSGSIDLEASEHRNILAIMLLDWPAVLQAGPVLHTPNVK